MKKALATIGEMKFLFGIIFSASVFLYMLASIIFQFSVIQISVLWQLLLLAIVLGAIETILLTDWFTYVIKLIAGYVIFIGTFFITFIWVNFTPSLWLSLTLLTIFYFGLQIGLSIYYMLSGVQLNQLLGKYKANK